MKPTTDAAQTKAGALNLLPDFAGGHAEISK